ncbi:MAG: cobalt-precorrin 5A hydrolase [Methanomassiliicoccus sp.]|nr:cobalt-precorrin 5A hydrolase [Methanomassiliicoccus sp.]
MRTAVVHVGHPQQAAEVGRWLGAEVFEHSDGIFERLFREYEAIVAIMAIGIVVRKIALLVRDKWVDPAVVVVTPDLRFSVPILGGHHGGNEIARKLSALGPVPVISTATDALGRDSVEEIASRNGLEVINKSSTVEVNRAFLDGDVPVYRIDGPAVVLAYSTVSVLASPGEYIVGIGCNRGTAAAEIAQAVLDALSSNGIAASDVLAYASTAKKFDEAGLVSAVREIGGRLFFIDDETINTQPVATQSRADLIGLIGVAEPSALALARRKELVMQRRAYGNVTIAIAR